jgi:hypothetical protein
LGGVIAEETAKPAGANDNRLKLKILTETNSIDINPVNRRVNKKGK